MKGKRLSTSITSLKTESDSLEFSGWMVRIHFPCILTTQLGNRLENSRQTCLEHSLLLLT